MSNAFGLDERTNKKNKKRWDSLRGRGNALDFDRAVFLRDVLQNNLHDNLETLKCYIVAELDEYPGKRISSFVRAVVAVQKDATRARWIKVGGKGMVLLTAVDGRTLRRVWRRINDITRRTKRPCVSEQTLRNILRDILGAEGYRDILTESGDSTGPRFNYRAQCGVYQREFYKLVTDGLLQKRHISAEVRLLLGMSSSRRARRRAA